jgi:metal-sulfur cluster biosynthetic enzyme
MESAERHTPEKLEEIRKLVIETLKTVYDPEIPVDIYELGLVYDLDISPAGRVDIRMTLTSPGCPVAEVLPREVELKVEIGRAHV